jgi:1,4-dihydroxy-2-naphthoyl-CoA hydrolase
MPFSYQRTIHFGDTDAAGVVFFANYFAICHEAYEEALSAAGLELGGFFRDTGLVVPIAKAEAEYLRPMQTGDKIRVQVIPRRLSENSFELRHEMFRVGPPEKRLAALRTEHVCIASALRERKPLPPALARWVDGV